MRIFLPAKKCCVHAWSCSRVYNSYLLLYEFDHEAVSADFTHSERSISTDILLPQVDTLYIRLQCSLYYTPKPRRPGVRCTTSALVCTTYTRGVQENAAIGLVILQSAGLVICFEIHFLCVTIE